MNFRYANMMRKYNVTYHLIRTSGGEYNDSGDWVPVLPKRIPLRGHIQPIDSKLQQDEGGRYTSEDRALYTVNTHEADEVIEYQGIQYKVNSPDERDYCDVNKYILKKVIVNDPIQ